jgi:hypothetical protein
MNTETVQKLVESTGEPALRAQVQGLFPTLNNLEAVLDLGISQLPITNANELVCLLMTFQNTLLKVQANDPI